MRIIAFISKTAGGRHGWYQTNEGFNVRKPLGVVNIATDATPIVKESNGLEGSIKPTKTARLSWWAKVKNWFKALWN